MRATVASDADAAVADIRSGATVLIGGFGSAGQPVELIEALIRQGATDLTVVNNNAGNGDMGLAELIRLGRVSKIICSFPRQSDSWCFDERYRAGEIELELVPQGNLAERIRAGGAGIGGFFTPTGYGTPLAEGKETRIINGVGHVFESPITADVALIKADTADRAGNLVYRKTARNFGPVMATAAAYDNRAGAQHRPGRRIRPGSRCDAGNLRLHHRPCRRRPAGGAVNSDRPLDKDELARRVAHDIPDGSFVNLGIGLPTKVSNFLDPSSGVVLHTENGMLGMGPEAHGDQVDPDLMNAGKIAVTELPGASYFHHADSFAMMRGGHLDICVLGAYQVSAAGDLANWHTGEPGAIPAVGGAMDLAIGAKRTFVMMNLLTRDGRSKIVPECSYPLTGVACVSRIYTDYAVFDIEPEGVAVRDLFGTTMAELQELIAVPLRDATYATVAS